MKERSSMKHEAIDRFTQHPHKITQHAQRMRKVWKKATGAGGGDRVGDHTRVAGGQRHFLGSEGAGEGQLPERGMTNDGLKLFLVLHSSFLPALWWPTSTKG